jgi:CRP/FNR family transcriptional regulator, anaerobic regulatory protein
MAFVEDPRLNSFYQALEYFIKIPAPEKGQIGSLLQFKKLQKGDYLVREGQVCKSIAFLRSGMIRHYYSTDKEEITRWISLSNTFSSSLASFILQKPSNENLQALEDCELVIIPHTGWLTLMKENASFQEVWMKNIEFNYLGMEERVFFLIAKSAEERYLNMMETQPRFIREVPQQYVASMLGTTPRHLSRIRKSLSR